MESINITEIIVAGMAFVGTLAGSYLSQRKSTALIAYRLEQLEKKVQAHNNLVERMYKCEETIAVLDNRESVSEHRLTDLEKKQN